MKRKDINKDRKRKVKREMRGRDKKKRQLKKIGKRDREGNKRVRQEGK